MERTLPRAGARLGPAGGHRGGVATERAPLLEALDPLEKQQLGHGGPAWCVLQGQFLTQTTYFEVVFGVT